jgi:hypothetical protein
MTAAAGAALSHVTWREFLKAALRLTRTESDGAEPARRRTKNQFRRPPPSDRSTRKCMAFMSHLRERHLRTRVIPSSHYLPKSRHKRE